MPGAAAVGVVLYSPPGRLLQAVVSAASWCGAGECCFTAAVVGLVVIQVASDGRHAAARSGALWMFRDYGVT